MATHRGQWGTRLGFILAAAGSAVGLGNIWKFPYMAGENGGAAFLIIYLVLVFSIGLSVMLCEFVIGRAAERNPVGAYAALKGGRWKNAGFLGVAAGFIILSFYSVVAGWAVAYIFKATGGLLTTSDPAALGRIFGEFSANPLQPLFYHGLFMALTVLVIIGGINGGIERTCRILLPLLFVLLVVLAIRSLTLPGAMAGLKFFLAPDFSKVTAATFNGALSQAFFSLSLGMGAMITYASYLSREVNLTRATLMVTLCDTSVAIIAGLVIMPAVFAFSFDPSAGPGLVFITLPAVFAQMPLGVVFAVLFFVLLVIAALTSAVSLLEVVVAYFVDERGWQRRRAAAIIGTIIFLLGIPSPLSFGVGGEFTLGGRNFFGWMDFVGTSILLPAGGISVSLFVGWAILPKALDEASSDGKHPFPLASVWIFISRWIAPAAIGWILISGLGIPGL